MYLKAHRARDLIFSNNKLKLAIVFKKFKLSTLNVTTLRQLAQRQDIERYMVENNIDMMGLQETKVKHNSKENRQKYLWIFSGEEKFEKHIKNNNIPLNNRFDAGVALVIKNKYSIIIAVYLVFHHYFIIIIQ